MNEPERARFWRTEVVKLTAPQLSNRIGYCVATIERMERGECASPRAWQKYRLACACVHAGIRDFNWENTKCLG